MVTNKIERISSKIIGIPVIVRAHTEGWVRDFEYWPTRISDDTSYIDCTQKFGVVTQNYVKEPVDPKIGYYDKDDLIVLWKLLIDTEDVKRMHAAYNGKMRITTWAGRYVGYCAVGKSDRLHSTVLGFNEPDYVIHHINCVSMDNRKSNLHILPKREHDSINHPLLDERKEMFISSNEYWKKRRKQAVNQFVTELAILLLDDSRAGFIGRFAETNPLLAKEILEAARLQINLSRVVSRTSENRNLNPHLTTEYLDTYEIEKYLKRNVRYANKDTKEARQIKMF